MIISKVEPSDNGVYVGGSVNALLALVAGLGRAGTSVEVLTSLESRKHEILQKYKPVGGEFHIMTNNQQPQSVKFGLTFLIKAAFYSFRLRKEGIDIVHGHSGYGIYAWLTYIVALILGVPSVHTIYCPIIANGSVDNKSRFLLKGNLAIKALNKMDSVMAMSANIAGSLRSAGVLNERIIVATTAVEIKKLQLNNINETVRQRLGLNQTDLVVVFVGNLMASKGLDLLVEAIGRVHTTVPNIRLVMTLEIKHEGFGERLDLLYRQIERLGIQDLITELGMIDYMPALLSEADLVVSPYRDTQGPSDLPLIMMEAMAAGVCVIGTKVGGIPELISDSVHGRLVEPDDIDSLATALVELAADPAMRNAYGECGRERILRDYGADKAINEHLNIYEELLT